LFLLSAGALAGFSLSSEGLTRAERNVLEHLCNAFNGFVELGCKHPADDGEFCRAIHEAQRLVALRVARRVDPGVWSLGQELQVGEVQAS
jgi:hypothetical protein